MSSRDKADKRRPSAAKQLSEHLAEVGAAAIAGGMSQARFEEIRKSIWFRVRIPVDYATNGYKRRSQSAEAKNRAVKQSINAATRSTARNYRQRWTVAESKMVQDAEISDEEIAKKIGRTLLAVQSHRAYINRPAPTKRETPAGRVPLTVLFEGRAMTRRQIMIETGMPPTTVKRRIRRLLDSGVKEIDRRMLGAD